MESTGHPAAGVAGQPSEVESKLLRGLVDYLRQKRPELRQEWASRLTDAQLLRVMRADEIFTEVTAVYDNYVNALETGSVEALRAYARDLSERIVRRGVETDEVLGTVLLLRDVLARALFLRHQGDPELLGRVLDVYEPAANRIAVIVGVSFVEERERVIREQQAAIRERAEMLHRLSTFLADASLALDAPGSLEEILQLVAEHARELVGAERCRAEIRLADGITIDAHAEAEPGTEPVSVSPADVAALYAAVAPGRRSLRMSSAELAAEPARRALEGAGHPVRSMRSWLVRPWRSRRQGGRADPGVRQARRRIHPPRRGGAGATCPDGGGSGRASAALRARAARVKRVTLEARRRRRVRQAAAILTAWLYRTSSGRPPMRWVRIGSRPARSRGTCGYSETAGCSPPPTGRWRWRRPVCRLGSICRARTCGWTCLRRARPRRIARSRVMRADFSAPGAKDAFWVYESPSQEDAGPIARMLAPWPGRVDVIVDGKQI